MKNNLTFKQRKFVYKYLKCWNASKAARLAGYTRRPNVVGSELLRHHLISSEIERTLVEVNIDAKKILYSTLRIATSDLSDFIQIKGNGKVRFNLEQGEKNDACSEIKTIRINPKNGEVVFLAMHDKIKALQLLFDILTSDKYIAEKAQEVDPIDAIIEKMVNGELENI